MKGLGNDIIEIERIRKAHEEHGDPFLTRLFTEKEQAYCFEAKDPYPRLAGRFAAKEAVAKALCSGFGKELSWLDIEILPNPKGKPVVQLRGKFADARIELSISHCHTHAIAVAIYL